MFRRKRPPEPIKVTNALLEFMGDVIVQDLRRKADLAGDPGTDYDAVCEGAGEGRLECQITVLKDGKEIRTYIQPVNFDPADPGSFQLERVGGGG